ncbi:hypothetical protein CYLTODRAFT_445733 [Cylindrobasidium torrendii FP15055 ss-10]|uniref:ABM domain-containing protein n=1 Tax=Cylindrobasidium torrendii FP15055 ss-10 TaxID=1314674 RepID=A0A0D7B5P3_9AGAR|nr:hypothetical protein CYLTODRAFT_445733 [Cylindrobasidium torrendii FP15055 ss-10]
MTGTEYLCVNAVIVIASADLEEFWKGFEDVFNKVIAEEECTLFERSYQEDKENDEVIIRLFEAWTGTVEWFREVQMNKPYYKPYLEATQKLWRRDHEFKIARRLGLSQY